MYIKLEIKKVKLHLLLFLFIYDVHISQMYLFIKLVLIKDDFNCADYRPTGSHNMRRRDVNSSCKKEDVVI